MAARLRADGHEVHFAGTPGGPEARLAREAGLVFHAVAARGFDRSRPLSIVVAILVLAASAVRAVGLIGRLRPAAVAGFGGYVSIPLGLASVVRRVPLVLHEQNSVPGLANRFLARWACAVGVTYPDSASLLGRARRVEVTGNPVRPEILAADRDRARAALALSATDVLVLVFGGSRGARHINEALLGLRSNLAAQSFVHVMHVAGRGEVDTVRALIEEEADDPGHATRYQVVDYLDDMGSALAAADIVVARAGATSIAEITALGRAAILVPYPYATDDHQTRNARDIMEAGGATLVTDDELDTPRFAEALETLIGDPTLRARMAAASKALGRRDAAGDLTTLIYTCADPHRAEVAE